ncbi:dihydroorotase [Teredinibacter sp. KSP-S5-2]|uniref:dihydroorotase n=1 Tax=Teredinibacter sp. KSP-S5-2 TaxID=3034506 RepID=UPI002934861E|nr:dihydroorotase [Teredinibacter sp. KSP-S5-2]WNO10193.1 dihydroorotase [Teredinibacter sp. KSP-S5-2]
MTQTLTLTAPDDWHIHLRDGDALQYTVPHAASSFARAIIMPNLVPPVTNAEEAVAYKERILQHVPSGENFTPLMVLYLTDNTTAEDIVAAKQAGVVACKLYPAGATTNSDSGVTNLKNIYPVLEAMQEQGILLLVHGEVTTSDIDIFDREAVFIEQILKPVIADFPELKVVLEHITTKDAVDFVTQASDKVAATITAHHLLFNRNHMLAGGIRPHFYCLPILKRNIHQEALIQAATSGNKKFFLGTDSAPHAKNKKEAACGCAGSYTAFAAIELYAEVFDAANALDKLEAFAAHFGPDFYGLPRNQDTITLKREEWTLPTEFEFGESTLVPIMAGETLRWQIQR